MTVRIAVVKESTAGEKRVSATPETVKKFAGLGAEIRIVDESGAELPRGFGLHDHVGEHPAHALEVAHLLPECGAVLYEFDGVIERGGLRGGTRADTA